MLALKKAESPIWVGNVMKKYSPNISWTQFFPALKKLKKCWNFFFSHNISPHIWVSFFSELKWTCVDGSASSGIPKYLENCRFQCNFKIPGRAEKGISVHKKSNPRPLYNRYFCHISNVKCFWISKKSIRKCIFIII